MRKFRIKADAIFEAEDIDDAMLRLAAHFDQIGDPDAIRLGGVDPAEIESGSIAVEPYHTREGV
jgi:hypothetical protein